MIVIHDKEPSKQMLPLSLGAGDMAIITLINVRNGKEPPFVYMLKGEDRVYDAWQDDFIHVRLVKSRFDETPITMVPIRQGRLVLNGHNPDHRELFKYIMMLDINESKLGRNKSVHPELYVERLIVDNEHVEMTPDGRLVKKGADMILHKKRATPHNLEKGREDSKLDRLTVDGEVYSDEVRTMSEEEAKKLLYKVIDALNEEQLLDVEYNKEKGLIRVFYVDGTERKPLVAFEGRGKGVWLNTMKSRLWKNRDKQPKVVGRVLAANETLTNATLLKLYGGKYTMDSLMMAFPVLRQMNAFV